VPPVQGNGGKAISNAFEKIFEFAGNDFSTAELVQLARLYPAITL
jgi:hypothetical protein